MLGPWSRKGRHTRVSPARGALESTLDGLAYSAKWDRVDTNLGFYKVFGKDQQVEGASFGAPMGADHQAVARFAITNARGPGKNKKMESQNLVLGWGPTRVWKYNARPDSCAVTFSRLDKAGTEGTEGTAACGGGGNVPACKERKFRATP